MYLYAWCFSVFYNHIVVMCFLLAAFTVCLAEDDDDLDIVTEVPIQVTFVEVAEGSNARLPCDLTPPTDRDRVSLIIWYKDGAKTPIYSLDVRERGLGKGREVKQTEGQISYSTSFPHSALLLESTHPQDMGLYKCRVDFKHSPTRNAHVNLSVIVAPSSVVLTDVSGATLPQSTAGPVPEGSALEVACVAHGGWPSPRLTWWQDNDMIDDSLDLPDSSGRVRNTLTLQPVTRQLMESRIECRASNSPLTDPIVVLLALDLLLLPLDVRLVGENLPLSAGSAYEVACRAVGSRPAPNLSWWRSGELLQAPTRVVTAEGDNVTTSTLTLSATREGNGQVLTCRAANPHMPDAAAIEDAWTLRIHYRPVASVRVGSSLNASLLREGADVYLECAVDANPPPTRVYWAHDGRPVSTNASAGLLVTNRTLVLQAVRRESSGAYSCTAENTEGAATSEPYVLNIKYEPRCSDNQQRVYGAARLEEVMISCDVDANPPASDFRWTFNNSVVHERRMEGAVEDGRSWARYVAFSETDYGAVYCSARNGVGSQLVPCIFHVVPAGVPDVPHNCTVANRSQSWVHVACSPGFDGGLPQQFTAEVSRLGAVVSNTTSRTYPEFTLTSLEPGSAYRVTIYSSNVKGRSTAAVTVEATTLGNTQINRRTTEATLPPMDPLVLVSSGIVIGVLLMVGVVLVVVVCAKRRSLQGSPDISSVHLDKTHSLLSITVPSTTLEDDRNPDVVPHNTEVEGVLLTTTLEASLHQPQWVTPLTATVALPKEAVLCDSWGVSVWPGSTPLQKTALAAVPPASPAAAAAAAAAAAQRNACTQTAQHKESTV